MKLGDDSSTTDRELHPEGSYVARLADLFIFTPEKPDQYGKMVPKVKTIWLSEVKDAEGSPIWLWRETTRKTGIYKGKKAVLRTIYEALLGQALGDDEAADVDSSILLGKYALLAVAHLKPENGGKPYARVEGISRLSERDKGVVIDMSGYRRPAKFAACLPLFDDGQEPIRLEDTP